MRSRLLIRLAQLCFCAVFFLVGLIILPNRALAASSTMVSNALAPVYDENDTIPDSAYEILNDPIPRSLLRGVHGGKV